MKNIIYLILFLATNFSYGQKSYSFNFYTAYESSNITGKNAVFLTFSDTLNDSHSLRIFSNNDTISNAILLDTDLNIKYTFKLNKKHVNNLDFSKDFNNCYKEQISTNKKVSSEICNRFKYYDVNSENKNDSIEVDTFRFYTNKRKKTIKAIVAIESFKSKQLKSKVPSDFISIISQCIATNFDSKSINKIHTTHILKVGLIIEEQLQLLETNTTNFSINIK